MLVSRMFSTHEDAMSAVGDLEEAGFKRNRIQVIHKTEADLTEAVLTERGVSDAHAHGYAEAINQGSVLVIVEAPVGTSAIAKSILETSRPSDAGAPTVEYEAVTQTTVEKAPPDPATPLSSWLGWRVLLHEPAPLSKYFNIPTLSAPPTAKSTSHGLPFLSDNPTPLSSRIGMKVLSDNPAPFSSWIGKKTLSDNPAPLSTWMNQKVLSNNPTPLSSWLNIPVLLGEKSTKP